MQTERSDAVQLWAVAALAALNVVALSGMNRLKRRGHRCDWSWESRRLAYWACFLSSVAAGMWLDSRFKIDGYLVLVKAYVFAFPTGILDLYFSRTEGVSLWTVAGAALWCSTSLLRQYWVVWELGTPGTFVVTELSPGSIALELLRFCVSLPAVGLLSDLIFSPCHRLAHLPALYKRNHKTHHEYTNKLTSLVLYHGELLDDFLMPLSTTIGGYLYARLATMLGFYGFSNFTEYLMIHNTLMSHAHDLRCARLLAPLPDSLNFVAYHYTHHLNPDKNFGLTEPSDWIWDKMLGRKTIATQCEMQDLLKKIA